MPAASCAVDRNLIRISTASDNAGVRRPRCKTLCCGVRRPRCKSLCCGCVCVSSTVYMWHFSLVVFGNILVVMTTFITWVVTTAVLPETHCIVQT